MRITTWLMQPTANP